MFRIEINTGNAAFNDPYMEELDVEARNAELARILREQILLALEYSTSERVERKLIDINGNVVGKYVID